MRGFQNGLTFLIWSRNSRDIYILVLQNWGLLWARVKGDLYACSDAKNRIFDGFFSSLGINSHNFVKNHPIFKNKGNIFHVAKQ